MGLGSGHNTHVGKFREALLLVRGHGAVERSRGVGSALQNILAFSAGERATPEHALDMSSAGMHAPLSDGASPDETQRPDEHQLHAVIYTGII
jgi:hypothetical protein